MLRKRYDLLIAMSLASLGVLMTLHGGPRGALAVILASLLVLLVPGYAAQALLFAKGPCGVAVRFTLSLGLSLCLAVLGAFVLNGFAAGLTPQTWSLFLAGITFAAGLGAMARRGDRWTPPRMAALLWPSRPPLRGAAMALAALGLVAGGLALNLRSASTPPSDGFTQLWLLPEGADSAGTVRLGIRNVESSSATYELRLLVGGQTVGRWPALTLKPNTTWDTTVRLPSGTDRGTPIEADLFRPDSTGVGYPYRHVNLWLAAGSGP